MFDISWQQLTLYYNKDIIELTYECSLRAFELFNVEDQNIQRDVEKRLMNILVIGNGFDLAHGLLTGYGDFLEFCRMVKMIFRVEYNKVSFDQTLFFITYMMI